MTELPTPSKTEKAVRERLAYHENIAETLRNLISLLWPRAREETRRSRGEDDQAEKEAPP